MNRLLILAFVAALSLCVAVPAAAVELKTSGEITFAAGFQDNGNFFDAEEDNTSEEDLRAFYRARMYFDWVANENLSGEVDFETGYTDFGLNDLEAVDARFQGGGVGANGDLEVKRVFIDFNWPDTDLNFRVGKFAIGLPAAVAGSPILDDDATGILTSYRFNDLVGMTFAWNRLTDLGVDDEAEGFPDTVDNADSLRDELDMFSLIVPITADGWSLTPYGSYLILGRDVNQVGNGTTTVTERTLPVNFAAVDEPALVNSTVTPLGRGLTNPANSLTAGSINDGSAFDTADENTDIYYIGAAFSLDMFDPFVFNMDFAYGSVDTDEDRTNRDGYMIAGELDYLMDIVTPSLFFAYSSGESEDDLLDGEGSNRFPTISPGPFGPTSFGFGGGPGPVSRLDSRLVVNPYQNGEAMVGLWTIGVALKDFSFLEDLTHTLRFAYGQGTNDAELTQGDRGVAAAGDERIGLDLGLTDEDSFFEVNFDHQYKIYENLTAYLNLGYINMDLDEETWDSSMSAPTILGVDRRVFVDAGGNRVFRDADPEETSAAWQALFALKYSF